MMIYLMFFFFAAFWTKVVEILLEHKICLQFDEAVTTFNLGMNATLAASE